MALTDLARAMKEEGKPVRPGALLYALERARRLRLTLAAATRLQVIGLAAGEPDFDTPAAIVEARVRGASSPRRICAKHTLPVLLRRLASPRYAKAIRATPLTRAQWSYVKPSAPS